MPNFDASALVEGQAEYLDGHLKGEWRMPNSNAFRTANTGALANPRLADLRTREDRAVNTYFPIRQASTNGTARVPLHTGLRGDSDARVISWSTFSETFSISVDQALNNVESWAAQFAATKRGRVFNLINRIDDWYMAQAIAEKTQVNLGGGRGSFNGTTFDYEVPNGDERLFFSNVAAMMEQNDYTGTNITGVVDSAGGVLANDLQNQGGSNDRNTAYQFAGFDGVSVTNKAILDVPTTYEASGLFFETGLVGVVPWIPQKNRKALNPEKASSSEVGDFGSEMLPGLDIPVAISAYAKRADATAENGSGQDIVLQYEMSVDVGFVTAPVSDFRGANDSVIYTAGVLV